MIYQILRKDILENFLSLRFILSLLLVTLLFAASGFFYVKRYEKQSQDYWRRTNKNLSALHEQSNQLYKLAFHEQEIFRKPKLIGISIGGSEKSLPNCVRVNAFMAHLPEVKEQSNFTLPHFSDIDWFFVISLILSFVALVFTYDCICGERETGTLRLMLAGTIPRHAILFAKYFCSMFTVGIPLLVGLLVNLIIVISSANITISGSEWLKIITIIFLSFLYISIFVLLGMFVSSQTGRSVNCMAILLIAWVGLVILIPSFGRIISDVLYETPTQVELARKLAEIDEQILSDAISGKFGDRAYSMGTDRSHPMNNPSARARYKTALHNAKEKAREDHHNRMLAQAFGGRNLTCISPTVIYQRASEAITGTGINRCVDLLRQARQYQANLKEYIRSKDSEDPNSLHLIFPDQACAQSWKTISHKSVDFDTVPKFQERDLALGQSLKLAIWDIGLLVLFNLVFFAAAFVSFLRYDVR